MLPFKVKTMENDVNLNLISRQTLEESYLKLQKEHQKVLQDKFEVNILVFVCLVLAIIFYWPPQHLSLAVKDHWVLWSLLVLATTHIGIMSKTSLRMWNFWRGDNSANFNIAKREDYKNINSDALKFMIKDAEEMQDFEKAGKIQKEIDSRKKV